MPMIISSMHCSLMHRDRQYNRPKIDLGLSLVQTQRDLQYTTPKIDLGLRLVQIC